MSRCSQFESLIWDAAETGIPSPSLSEHLSKCAACREKLARLENAVEGFAVLRRVAAPDPTQKAWARVAGDRTWNRLVPSLGFGLLVLAAAIMFILSARPAPLRPARQVNTQAERPSHKQQRVAHATTTAPHACPGVAQKLRYRPVRTVRMVYCRRGHVKRWTVADKRVCVAKRELSELEKPCAQTTTVVDVPREVRHPVTTNLSPTYCVQALPEEVTAPRPSRSYAFD